MHIAQNWRLNAQRYALQGVKCDSCGTILFPPRAVCPQCQSAQAEHYTFVPVIPTQREVIDLPRYERQQAAR